MTLVDTPVAVCEYKGSPELAYYVQHNHMPIHTSKDGEDNNSRCVYQRSSGPQQCTDIQIQLEDNVIVNVCWLS
jgi:hypothetical protein